MDKSFPHASDDTRKLNPHLFGGAQPAPPSPVAASKRIKQRTKPMMNKLEQEFFGMLKSFDLGVVRGQAVRFRLANGVDYTPDFFCPSWMGHPRCWEVKGKQAWDDAIVKLKVAAHEWPEIRWILVWKENGEWKEQRVEP